MNSKRLRLRWQFSLRSFLLAVLIVGPLAAVIGPIILESITEWKPPRRPIPSRPKTSSAAPSINTESYYESGETPLY